MTELTGFVSFRLSPHSRKRRRHGQDPTTSPPLIGHIFQDDQSQLCYLLVVPQTLSRHICHAAHYGERIRLSRFASFPLEGHADLCGLLEVHSDGFELIEPFSEARTNRTEIHRDDILSLPEVLRREAVDKLTGYKNSFTFHAKVLAISPILTFDPDDPCGLMEMYDQSTACSCVVVLRRDSLVLHAAIRPGEDLTLSRVKRMPWSTPSALAKKGYTLLSQRIPNLVFVVDNPNQFEWFQGTNGMAHSEPPQATITLSGTIQTAHMTVADSGIENFRYLVVRNLDGHCCNLFMSHLPLPSDVQHALQPGAMIVAYNLHRPSRLDYSACLRSKLVLVQAASESKNVNLQRYNRSIGQMRPCAYTQQQNTDAYWICCRRFDTFVKSIDRCVGGEFRDTIIHALLPEETKRNSPNIAYAEFFDHGMSDQSPDHDASVTALPTADEPDGCFLSGFERRNQRIPGIVPLAVVQKNALEKARPSMEDFLSQSIAQGWTGAVTLDAGDLFVDMGGSHVYTGGRIRQATSDMCPSQLASVHDGKFSLPVSIQHNKKSHYEELHEFGLVLINFVAVSFVYLGHFVSENRTLLKPSDFTDSALLPPFPSGSSLAGSCALVKVSGHLFLVSMRIDAERIVSGCMPETSHPKAMTKIHQHPIHSIATCLDPSVKAEENALVEGCMLRKYFKLQKHQNYMYKGSMFIFSHLSWKDMSNASPSVKPCTLQSIDMKPTIRIDPAKRKELQETVEGSLGLDLTGEQLTLATAWWYISDNEHLCALLDGGWDELVENSPPMTKSKCVVVRFPRSKATVDERRGYLRIRCSIDDLAAFFAMPDSLETNPGCQTGGRLLPQLHFIGGRRFFAGMLSARSRRRLLEGADGGQPEHGERLDETDHEATPCHSLAEIHWNICRDLQMRSHTTLAPSLVRKLRNGASLGILFCSAIAECTKCFSSLRIALEKRSAIGESDGLRSSFPVAPTFWTRRAGSEYGAVNSQPARSMVASSPLRCPNKCNPSFAGIKWECSGLIDDGTGQAKLLAERDAALVWLGMTKKTVNRIEQGAFLNENGIVFSKGMPPKPYLRSAVQTAQCLAREESIRWKRPLCEEDVLKYMTPTACAEYLMQRHCRESQEPMRELVYYVRCKPLGDPLHLNQSRVDLTVPGLKEGDVHRRDHATYSLPALKLNLVDCSVMNGDVVVNK